MQYADTESQEYGNRCTDLRIILARYTASIMSFDLMAKDFSSSSTLRLGNKLKTSCVTCQEDVRLQTGCKEMISMQRVVQDAGFCIADIVCLIVQLSK